MIKSVIVVVAVLVLIAACGRPRQQPCCPFDAKNVPADYVLRGDGWWVHTQAVGRVCT